MGERSGNAHVGAVGLQIAEPVEVGPALLVGQPALVQGLQVVSAAAQVGGGLGAGVALFEGLLLGLGGEGLGDGQHVQRHELCVDLETRHLAEQPRLTLNVLSQRLRYPYSVVKVWENCTRLFCKSNVLARAAALGYGLEEVDALLTTYGAAVLPDEHAGTNTGSRIETELNDRVKALRKERRLSIREMADVTGISTGHWQRIELNRSNLSVAQIRQIAKRLNPGLARQRQGRGQPGNPARPARPLHARQPGARELSAAG